MQKKLTFQKNIFDNCDIKKHLPFIESVYAGTCNLSYSEIMQKAISFLTSITRTYIKSLLGKKEASAFTIEPRILLSSLLGTFNGTQKKAFIDIRHLIESVKAQDLASIVGTALHEATHYIDYLTYEDNSIKKIASNAFESLNTKSDTENKAFYELLKSTIVPFLEKTNNTKYSNLFVRLNFKNILYFNSPFEKNANQNEEDLLISVGGKLAEEINNNHLKIQIFKNFFGANNNKVSKKQSLKRTLKNSDSNFLNQIKNLSYDKFIDLLTEIEKYANQLELKSLQIFDNKKYINENCYNYFLCFFVSNLSEKQEKEFIKFLKQTNNIALLNRIDIVFKKFDMFNKQASSLLKNASLSSLSNAGVSIRDVCIYGNIENYKTLLKSISKTGDLELVYEMISRISSSVVNKYQKLEFKMISTTFKKLIATSILKWKDKITWLVNNGDTKTAKQLLAKSKLAKSILYEGNLFSEIKNIDVFVNEIIAQMSEPVKKSIKNNSSLGD